MKKIAIIGSGDLAQQIAWHIKQDGYDEVIGYFDDYKSKNTLINELPVLGKIENIQDLYKEKLYDELLIGIGYNHLAFRNELFNKFKKEIPFATFIHSSCYIDKSSIIEQGSIIYPGSIIDQRVVIEENVLINIGCSVAHDSQIGAHSFLAPRVAIAGFVNIGIECFVGINSTIIDNIKITDNCIIGGGTVVIKNIENKGKFVGNPARLIKNYNDTI